MSFDTLNEKLVNQLGDYVLNPALTKTFNEIKEQVKKREHEPLIIVEYFFSLRSFKTTNVTEEEFIDLVAKYLTGTINNEGVIKFFGELHRPSLENIKNKLYNS